MKEIKKLTKDEFLEKGYANLWLEEKDLPKFKPGSQSERELSDLIHNRLYNGFLWDWMKACADLCCPREIGWYKFNHDVQLERGKFSCRIVTGDKEILDCYADVVDSPDGPQLFNASYGIVIEVQNALMEMRRSNPDCVKDNTKSLNKIC